MTELTPEQKRWNAKRKQLLESMSRVTHPDDWYDSNEDRVDEYMRTQMDWDEWND